MSAPSAQPPAKSAASTSGMPTTAVPMRTMRLREALELPELPVARRVRLDCSVQILLAEIRPQRRSGVILAVGSLPDQEIREAHLAGRADDKIRVRQFRRIEIVAE